MILIDENLPWHLVKLFADNSLEAMHLIGTALESATDEQIWDHVRRNGWIFLTKDSDYLQLLMRCSTGRLIHIQTPNLRRTEAVVFFESQLGAIQTFVKGSDRLLRIKWQDRQL